MGASTRGRGGEGEGVAYLVAKAVSCSALLLLQLAWAGLELVRGAVSWLPWLEIDEGQPLPRTFPTPIPFNPTGESLQRTFPDDMWRTARIHPTNLDVQCCRHV